MTKNAWSMAQKMGAELGLGKLAHLVQNLGTGPLEQKWKILAPVNGSHGGFKSTHLIWDVVRMDLW